MLVLMPLPRPARQHQNRHMGTALRHNIKSNMTTAAASKIVLILLHNLSPHQL